MQIETLTIPTHDTVLRVNGRRGGPHRFSSRSIPRRADPRPVA